MGKLFLLQKLFPFISELCIHFRKVKVSSFQRGEKFLSLIRKGGEQFSSAVACVFYIKH